MQIYFIRHGQSTNNALPDDYENHPSLRRSEDPELTEIGLRQAQLTAEELARRTEAPEDCHCLPKDPQNRLGYGLTHLYCGLNIRAVHTGSIIAEKLNLPLLGNVDMHESGGIYRIEMIGNRKETIILHGKNETWFKKHFPRLQILSRIDKQGWWPGGIEDQASWQARAFRVLEFLKDRHAGTNDRVGVISHGTFFAYIFRALFKTDTNRREGQPSPFYIGLNNCAITRIDLLENRFELIYNNKANHIPTNLLT